MSGCTKASEVLYHGHFQFLRFAPGELEIATNLLKKAEEAVRLEQMMVKSDPQPTVWAEDHASSSQATSAAPTNTAPSA